MLNEPTNSKNSEFESAKSSKPLQYKSTYLADHRSINAVQLQAHTSNQAPIQRTKWKWSAKNKSWSVHEEGNHKSTTIDPEVVGYVDGEIYDSESKKFTGEVVSDEASPLLANESQKRELLGEEKAITKVSKKFYAQKISIAIGFVAECSKFLNQIKEVSSPFKSKTERLKALNDFIFKANTGQSAVLDDENARSKMWAKVAQSCKEAGEIMNDLIFTLQSEPGFNSQNLRLDHQFETPLDEMGIEVRSAQKTPYTILSDEKHDQIKSHLDNVGKGKSTLSTGIAIGHTAAGLSHHTKVAEGFKEAGTYVGAAGGILETVDGIIKVKEGVERADSALGKASDIAEGTASALKGGSSAVYFGGQIAGESAKTLAATQLGHLIPGATLALGGVQIASGVKGTIDGQSSLNSLNKEDVVKDEQARNSMTAAMTAKRNESIAKIAKGALTVAAGGVLLASLTNPVGWALLAATGVIAFGMSLSKKFSQRTKGKEIAELKNKEYQIAYRSWVNDGKVGPEPKLNQRYDKSRITATSWRTYSDIYKEEMVDQANMVAQTIYAHIDSTRSRVRFSEEQAIYIQVVKNLGLRIDLDNNKPTIAAIRKELLSKLT
tara:strand:+ start:1690 stop:3507 length:1818 start_codon:yes stop_codon:yes gene_type:complete